jgi:hypothetical protein
MGIVFFCQSCGARFEVDAKIAGKKGRCNKCGQTMSVPRAEQLASMVGMPALAVPGVGTVSVPRAGSVSTARAAADVPSMSDWLKVSMSKVGLAAISQQGILKRPVKPSPLDDAEDSKPYSLAKPDRRAAYRHDSGPANALVVAWKHEVGLIARIFRWLNESAYVVSIPFVIIGLFGIAVKNRPIAVFGATFVVALNLGRIVAGVANLAVVPLREGLNFRKLKKPARRVIEPVVWICGVALAFTFIPWLSSDGSSAGNISDRIRSTAESFKNEFKGEVENVAGQAKNLNIEELGAQAQSKLKGVVDKASGHLNKLGSPAGEKSTKSADGVPDAPP